MNIHKCNHCFSVGAIISFLFLFSISIQVSAQRRIKRAPLNDEVYSAYAGGQKYSFIILSEAEKTVEIVRDKKNLYKNSEYIIPEKLEYAGKEYTVISIGDNAFAENGKLYFVKFPSTLKKIGNSAFESCFALANIEYPEGLEEIGESAFRHVSAASKVFPASLKRIGKEAFVCSLMKTAKTAYGMMGSLYKSPNSSSSSEAQMPNMFTLNIPDGCQVEENVFGKHATIYGIKSWTESAFQIIHVPDYITIDNAKSFGIATESIQAYKSALLRESLSENSSAKEETSPVDKKEVAAVQKHQPVAPSVISDVDQDIPEISATNSNSFAIIIANENYQYEVPVEYALHDGEIFREYCIKSLGLPEENVHISKDATLNNIYMELDWMTKVAKAYQGEANIIIYYAGHGVPDEASGSSYLLPVDGRGAMLRTGMKLTDLYKSLSELQAKSITIFMDACFSGSKRGEGMLASARGVAIKAKGEAPKGNMVVFSAAQGDETAYPFKEKGHGLFTYFLLKKLQESKGTCSLGEIDEFVCKQVSRRSIVVNGKSQTPITSVSESMADWKKMKLQ